MLKFSRFKITIIMLTVLLGVLTALPNFFTDEQLESFPSYLPSSKVALGLDLQGGSYMLLEVDMDEVIKERLETVVDDARRVLRKDKHGYTGLKIEDGRVVVRPRHDHDTAAMIKVLQSIAMPIPNAVSVIPPKDLAISEMDDGRIVIELTNEGLVYRRHNAVQQSIEIVRKRVDEMGTREPSIQGQGDDRILVQVPGLQDPRQLREILETTAKLTFHLVDVTVSAEDIARGRVPPGTIIMPHAEEGFAAVAIRRRVMVSGENLVDAQPSFDSRNGRPVISFRFDVTGARKFGEVTRANVGRPFAVVLDGKVLTAPNIQEPILSGSGQISGSYTVESATNMAVLFRAGALPAPMKILEERTVGPDLGADSVAAGKNAALIGLFAVMVFIILTYGWFGVATNVALIVNITLLFGGLSVLGATLTLPGIAGIVLTIGMAVDANVLVFERIREELRAGVTPFAAVDKGYSAAMSTIMDANITTMIAAVILFQFGTGPVKGFAVTLAIGILTSVFTAVTLTRLFIATWLRRKRPQSIKL